MKKDFAKKRLAVRPANRAERTLRYWATAFVVVLLIAGGSGFYVSRQHPDWAGIPRLSSAFTQMQAWVVERKSRLSRDIKKVRQLAASKQEPQAIHFEFYTELPSMKVPVPVVEKGQDAVVPVSVTSVGTGKSVSAGTQESSARRLNHAAATAQVAERMPRPQTGAAIFNAEQLHRELTEEFSQKKYIIQLGVFKNADAAERYRQSLAVSGLTASVVKTRLSGKAIFRVQSGPFLSMNQAKEVQRQWQRKSVNGIVRRVEW
ncbi:hypothetical protein AQUSIP_03680 [Aquicella siphonis]|uniref:SPOR domain-containing protein n=1 Tax=Aquicella siphonis TaxID=254247 RepID=A0A5E4PF03_9COXI|nr:SPOR domain-containing protein [Aquicella siphonis]VVC75092.1 hypothetical protein AQUSIP_03680 [Aquicella siphonis]